MVRVERTELLEAPRTAQVVQTETADEVGRVSKTDEEPLTTEGPGSWRYRVLSRVRDSKVRPYDHDQAREQKMLFIEIMAEGD